MLRRHLTTSISAAISTAVQHQTSSQQVRCVRMANADLASPLDRDIMEGRSAGQVSLHNEICANPDHEDEKRLPKVFPEYFPKHNNFNNSVGKEYKWGKDSLSMYLLPNEGQGAWHNAHETALVSLWDLASEKSAFGTASGIILDAHGTSAANWKPTKYRGRSFGVQDKKGDGAIHKTYDEVDAKSPTHYTFPHTQEHLKHNRLENPTLKDTNKMATTESKRLFREISYHFSHSIKNTLVDGYFGSHPGTSTAYRVINDSVAHGYFASISAIRQKNLCDAQEVSLQRKTNYSSVDEFVWRRPGVTVYHAAGFQFEIPRIVEEFGGPRPKDVGMVDNREKFIAVDPYSIPMKSMICGAPAMDPIKDQTAFLAARWGYYADERELLTIAGDGVVNAKGDKLTVLVHSNQVNDIDKIRASSLLYGAHHFRIAEGLTSRAWDSTSISTKNTKPKKFDIVEDDLGLIHRPLPTRIGVEDAISHRFEGLRSVKSFGTKQKHNYRSILGNTKAAAAAGGNTFSSAALTPEVSGIPRPSAFNNAAVDFVIVTAKGGAKKKVDAAAAAKAIVEGIQGNNWLYAEAEKLEATFAKQLETVGGLYTVGASEANALAANLGSKGTA